MKKAILAVFMILATMVMPIYALSENFTLNFPQGNNTTSYITFESEQQVAANNLVALFAILIVVVVVIIALVKKLKQD